MPSRLGVLAALALLLLAAALLLWQWAARRAQRRQVGQRLARRLEDALASEAAAFDARRAKPPAPPLALDPWSPPAAAQRADGTSRWTNWQLPLWLQDVVTRGQLAWALAAVTAAALLAAGLSGVVAAGAALLLGLLACSFTLWWRTQKSRRRLRAQLPPFIDSMVRLISVGNATYAAFQSSIAATEQPLHRYVDGAAALVRAGIELDQALRQMARGARLEEMHLLAAILGLGMRYGGRADTLLERVANFMRDRELAERELSAMSSETRLSAWILGLLPIGVGTAIVFINPDYFMHMWQDGTGRTMIFAAFGLQLLGVLLLYRLARLT